MNRAAACYSIAVRNQTDVHLLDDWAASFLRLLILASFAFRAAALTCKAVSFSRSEL